MRRLLAALLMLLPFAAGAADRVALVVGNSAYRAVPALPNPTNDANAVAAALERLGFDVLTGIDLDQQAMRRLVRDFGSRLNGAEVALFFYAGHGIQVAGRNYLLPIDAELESEADLDFAAVPADLVLRQMDHGADTKLVILDACRNNPFTRALTRSMGATRAVDALGRGLARLDAPGGSLIAFATDPGDVALDGSGRHSPFTEALLDHIETPGLEVNLLLTRVRADVYRTTGERQRPWTSSSLIGEIYLAPGDATPAPAASAPDPDTALEIALWNAAERGNTAADYQAYLDRYPEGVFAGLARSRAERFAGTAPADREAAEPATPPTETAALDPEAAEDALALSTADRREVQERLTLLGHDTRGIDGVFGPGTRRAISGWQANAGEAATGFLTADQIAALNQATDDRLEAFRVEQRRKAEAARKAAAAAASSGGRSTAPASGSIYRATATCPSNGARGTARHADRQQAMLAAARACVANGGAPACCAGAISVSP